MAKLDRKSIETFKRNLEIGRRNDITRPLSDFVEIPVNQLITHKFKVKGYVDRGDERSWENWGDKKIFEKLFSLYPRDTFFSQNEPEEIIEKLDSLRLVIEFRGEYESEEPYIEEIHTMQREMSEAIEKLTRSEMKTIIDKLIKNV